MKRKTDRTPVPTEATPGGFDTLAAALGGLGVVAPRPAVPQPPAAPLQSAAPGRAALAAPAAAPPPRDEPFGSRPITLRIERKGHGGHTATVLEGAGLAGRDLDALARDLRRAFGCGASVRAGAVVLQGDRIDAASGWLAARGATRVKRGT